MTTIDNIMALANAYAESYRDALAPNVNALVDEAQTALRTALTDSHQEAFARGMAVRPASAAQPARVPVAITRDDTEHGMYYYRASEVDALMAAQPVREPLNKSEWPKHPSAYVNDEYIGYSKSDLTSYAMQVLQAHGIGRDK